MRRVAVIGSGISGLSAADALAGEAAITLFEASGWFGGHAHTVDLTLDGVTHGVDTGFLVLNERTYPGLLHLFERHGIDTAASEMSFSVQVPAAFGGQALEWSGSNLGGLFAQPRNLLRPAFWRMLVDLTRFNRTANGLVSTGGFDAGLDAGLETLGDWLDRHRFGTELRDWYLLPMLGCIWSCPTDQMLRFPMATMLRFCHNHGLLQVSGRPRWLTVRGGSRNYVTKMRQSISDSRLNTPVRRVRRQADAGASVLTGRGWEHFDAVVFACHSDQALALIDEPTEAEVAVLGAIRYQPNRVLLHTDTSLMPTRRRAWAAWNYERAEHAERGAVDLAGASAAPVCVHYWINRLQPLPFSTPVLVSLNPVREPAADKVHAEFGYDHPVFDQGAIAAQRRLSALQGAHNTWFCGAWTGYGFHEDGLLSGQRVAAALLARWAASPPAVMAVDVATANPTEAPLSATRH